MTFKRLLFSTVALVLSGVAIGYFIGNSSKINTEKYKIPNNCVLLKMNLVASNVKEIGNYTELYFSCPGLIMRASELLRKP
jgi:hypothetical protein